MKHLISIIIPTYNEENYIKACLVGITEFSLPDDIAIEILVIDGNSEDKTVNIVKGLIRRGNSIKLFKNPQKIQSVAMNIGINKSKGDWILRLDAHSIYPKDYLELCYKTAKITNAENVGGLVNSVPGSEDYFATLVQAITTHPFGVGDSGFRTGMKEGEVDTVPFGFFKKQIFKKIGFFDERLIRAQDYEFNKRIIKNGGKIWLNQNIVAHYYNQKSILSFYKKQIFLEAPYNAYMWYLAPYTFTYRHAITSVFTTGVIGGLFLSPFSSFVNYIFIYIMVLYFFLAVVSALQQAKKYKNLLHVFTLPISFFLYHFLHGLGVINGLLRLATGTSPVQKIEEPWKGYGSFRIKIDEIIKHRVRH